MKISEILERGKIKRLASSTSGTTGEAHIAVFEGKKYVLRICSDEKTAKWYAFLHKKLDKFDILPRLLEHDGKYLLVEYLEGRDLKENESKENIKEVGKICAIVNNIKYKGKYEDRFLFKLKEILDMGVISREKAREIEELYRRLKKKTSIKLSLDIGDCTNDNFRISRTGRIYFVDIEGIKYHIMGMSIAKAFLQWFKTDGERKEFIRGYNLEHSFVYFNKDYRDLCSIIFLVQRIRFKHNKGEKAIVKRSLNKLYKILAGK